MDLSTSFCHRENVIEIPTQGSGQTDSTVLLLYIFKMTNKLTVYIDQNLPGGRYFEAKMFASVF